MKHVMLLTAATMLLLLPAPARADTESPALAKYRARVGLAVKKALAFIATRQRPDGCFDPRGPSGPLPSNALAGLAGMAYLSVGHTPGRGPYGDVLNRCIDYILATPVGPHVPNVPGGSAEGYLARGNPYGRMYSHAIATLFLCEVSGMVDPERQKKIDVLLPKALKVILDAQAVKKEARFVGGWRYKPDSPDSDLSVSGWCLMALRSARLNGAPVPAEAIKKAIGFVNRCYNGGKGHRGPHPSTFHNWPSFNYQPGTTLAPHNAHGTSAVGLFCREICGYHDDEINRRCAGFVMAWAGHSLPAAPGRRAVIRPSEYVTYYASQAMFQLGGTYWERFAPQLYKYVLNSQGTDGSWHQTNYGRVYETAMYTLALTVTYRQLPIYQR